VTKIIQVGTPTRRHFFRDAPLCLVWEDLHRCLEYADECKNHTDQQREDWWKPV